MYLCMQAAELRAPQSSRQLSIFKSFVDQVKSEVDRCAAGCLLRRVCSSGMRLPVSLHGCGDPDAWLRAAQQPGAQEVRGPAQEAERGRAVQVPSPRTCSLTRPESLLRGCLSI